MTVALAAVRLGIVGPASPAMAYELLPLLIALGLLCVIGLARRSHPSMAWLATIGVAFVVTIDLAAYARAVRPVVDGEAWRWLGIGVSLSALLAVSSAAAYAASRPRLRRRLLTAPGVAVVLVIIAAAGWAIANPSDTTLAAGSALGSLGVVTRSFIVITSTFTLIGVVGEVLPAVERARHRVAVTHQAPAPRGERARAWLRAFTDEVAPGRSRARRAVLAERSRVARDIHADIVPGLRQALASAERGMPPGELAASLREVLADIEAVGAAQHPIQLEIGGLVAALEWLAERVERRSDVTVTLEVGDSPVEAHGEPPAEVVASAFRVADLALGNVVRHAPHSSVAVNVVTERAFVELSICDDGPGITDGALAAARAAGRRGIPDMAAEAASCDALVNVGPGPNGAGTCVRFAWRRPPAH